MQYQCIFSDIDGTLLNSQHEVTDRTKIKIHEIASQGIPFVLVSARTPGGIKKVMDQLEVKIPMISYSGGLVTDENNKIIYSKGLSVETAREIYEFIKRNFEVSINICSNDCWMSDNLENPWVEQEAVITGLTPKRLDFTKIDVVHKILCMGDKNVIDSIEQKLLEKYNFLSVYKSKDTYLEIMEGTISKSNAIKILCNKFNIDITKTISFGDNYNDIDMLLTTGIGFAMANAPQGVLNQIARHTKSNDQDGIVYALENLIEKE